MSQTSLQLAPILGQLLIIAGQTVTVCFIAREINKMPYTFWYILVNRIRYIKLIGVGAWLKSMVYSADKYEPEYHPTNESYTWLRNNPIYTAYVVYFWSTLGIIFGLLHQFELNQVYTKPKEFFWSSPARSLSLVYILFFLLAQINEDRITKKKQRAKIEELHNKLIEKSYR